MTYRSSVIALLFTIAIFGCQSQDEEPTPFVPPSPPVEEGITYLALGDSYTIGESVEEEERYPMQLADSLRKKGLDMAKPKIIARTGWTTDELLEAIDKADISENEYDLVSLLIGVNNQYRGRPVESYRPEFTELLERAIGFAGGDTSRVFVVSIPDYAFTSFGDGNPSTSQGIDEYNAANREISEVFGVQYFNITPISREGLDNLGLESEDGLHPSGEQYRRWVKLMMKAVPSMLD